MGHDYDRHYRHRQGGRGRGSGRYKEQEEQEVIDVPRPPPVQQPVPTTPEWSTIIKDPSGAYNYQAQRQSDGTWKYNIMGLNAVEAQQAPAPPAPLAPAPPAAAYDAYAEPAPLKDDGRLYQGPQGSHHQNRERALRNHGRRHRHGHGGNASRVVSSTRYNDEILLILPRDTPFEIRAPHNHSPQSSVYSGASSRLKVEEWLDRHGHRY